MRISAFLSAAMHVGVVAAGLFWTQSAPPAPSEATQMIVIPLELVTIGDVTDVAAVTEDAKIEDEAKEEETAEVASAAAPKVEEDTVALPDAATPPPPQPEPKKAEVKPPPSAKQGKEDVNSFIDDVLAGVTKSPPKQARVADATAANTTNAPPRLGVGQQKKMQATIEAVIQSQLISKRCWTDHSDMADAPRLKATIRIWFARGGKFSRPYELIAPREPSGDLPMQTFVSHARRALDMCNALGWQVPEEYFQLPQPQYIDVTFLPKVAAH